MAAYIQAIATNYEQDGLSWHKEDAVNEPITEIDNITSAMEKCGMENVEVVKAPISMKINDVEIVSDKLGLVLVNVPWTENGIQDLERQVSKTFTAVSNARYAEILNPLAQTYQVGSVLHCGPLGEVMVIQFKLPDFYVNDKETERHTSYLLVSENRRTGEKHYHITTVRVVCANTYARAISGVKSLPNGKDSEMNLMFRTSLEECAIKSRQGFMNDMDKLFTQKVNDADVSKVANILFPMPKRPGFLNMIETARNTGFDFTQDKPEVIFANKKEKDLNRDFQAAMDRQEQYMNAFFTSYNTFNDEYAYAGNTAYALWNASTDVQKATSEIYGRTETDVATYKLLFGDRGKSLDSVYNFLTK